MAIRRKNIVLYPVAGRIWSIPSAVLPPEALRQGPKLESECSDRINKSVANEICGSSEALTANQLVFLCQITGTKNSEVAMKLGVNRSNVSVWSNNGRAIPKHESTALKKWFWQKIFGQNLGKTFGPIPTNAVFEDDALLRTLRDEAILSRAAFAVTEEKPQYTKRSVKQVSVRERSPSSY